MNKEKPKLVDTITVLKTGSIPTTARKREPN